MPPSSLQPRVLVVDDQEDILELLGEYLRARGLEVSTAYEADDAMRFVEEGEVDVVLTDLALHERSGLELLEQLQQVDGRVAAVAMTGFPTVANAVKAMRLGAKDFLCKPFRLQSVYDAILGAAAELERERVLQRREAWLRLLEALLEVRRANELGRVYGLLAGVAMGDCEAEEVAVWVRGPGGLEAVARGGEVRALAGMTPGALDEALLEGNHALHPVRVVGQVVAVIGVAGGRSRTPGDLARMAELSEALGQAMERVGWEDLSERAPGG